MTANDIAIVGAGPYGLSLAAHLAARGADFRIFGTAMHSWLANMPAGMLLKSDGFASTLYDPDARFTLAQFCSEHGYLYRDQGWPVRLDIFAAYGQAFQKRLVPNLEDDSLVSLRKSSQHYELLLASGKRVCARRVVLAVGLDYFRYIPGELAALPASVLSHSADIDDPARFRGREVAVVGAGASAIDLAVLLHEAGAAVHLLARPRALAFGSEAGLSRPWLQRLRKPDSGIGPGLKNRLFADAPGLYRHLPDSMRIRTTATFLGPSAGWFMRARAQAVPLLAGCRLLQAEMRGECAQLSLHLADGRSKRLPVEHVIAATGYRADVRRLPFLSDDMVAQLQRLGSMPRLSSSFESSLPGLYFIGPISANSFGPVMRFAFGAGYTSRRLANSLAPVTRPVRSSLVRPVQ